MGVDLVSLLKAYLFCHIGVPGGKVTASLLVYGLEVISEVSPDDEVVEVEVLVLLQREV